MSSISYYVLSVGHSIFEAQFRLNGCSIWTSTLFLGDSTVLWFQFDRKSHSTGTREAKYNYFLTYHQLNLQYLYQSFTSNWKTTSWQHHLLIYSVQDNFDIINVFCQLLSSVSLSFHV